MDQGVEPDDRSWYPPAAGSSPWLALSRRRALSAVLLVYLVYLVYVGIDIAQCSHGTGEIAGYVVLGLFCLAYMAVAERLHQMPITRFWCLVGVLCALLLPLAVPSWHDSIVDDLDMVTSLAIPVIALVSWGLQQIVLANLALADARADVARLTAETERARIARDLHDLLGHSLTTITVKAGLARRLGAVDNERALQEIAEVEQLSRRSLQDVRAVVAGYREVTLTGELASGRELLRAADLPTAVDTVDPAHQELLGWVVREG